MRANAFYDWLEGGETARQGRVRSVLGGEEGDQRTGSPHPEGHGPVFVPSRAVFTERAQ